MEHAKRYTRCCKWITKKQGTLRHTTRAAFNVHTRFPRATYLSQKVSSHASAYPRRRYSPYKQGISTLIRGYVCVFVCVCLCDYVCVA